MVSEFGKVLEPGDKESNTPIYMCIQSQSKKSGCSAIGKKEVVRKTRNNHIIGKPVYVIHKDGSIIHYTCAKDCIRNEHTTYGTILKNMDKNMRRRNTKGIQFRSKRPHRRCCTIS